MEKTLWPRPRIDAYDVFGQTITSSRGKHYDFRMTFRSLERFLRSILLQAEGSQYVLRLSIYLLLHQSCASQANQGFLHSSISPRYQALYMYQAEALKNLVSQR